MNSGYALVSITGDWLYHFHCNKVLMSVAAAVPILIHTMRASVSVRSKPTEQASLSCGPAWHVVTSAEHHTRQGSGMTRCHRLHPWFLRNSSVKVPSGLAIEVFLEVLPRFVVVLLDKTLCPRTGLETQWWLEHKCLCTCVENVEWVRDTSIARKFIVNMFSLLTSFTGTFQFGCMRLCWHCNYPVTVNMSRCSKQFHQSARLGLKNRVYLIASVSDSSYLQQRARAQEQHC